MSHTGCSTRINGHIVALIAQGCLIQCVADLSMDKHMMTDIGLDWIGSVNLLKIMHICTVCLLFNNEQHNMYCQ
jgi:hypothetical protein